MLEFGDKGISATEFAVLSGEVIVANVYKAVGTSGAVFWGWTFKTTDGPPGFFQRGSAMNLDEAKAMIEAQWTQWLYTAGLRQG